MVRLVRLFWFRISLGALALLHGCAAPPPDGPIGRSAAPIIGGTADSADPGVVLLVSYPANESTFDTCTASVIAPTVLLTAAHCIDAANHPGYKYGAFLGPDASQYATAAELVPELVAASSVVADPAYDATATDYPADIGVVLLASPLSIAALPINLTPLDASIAGTSARIVGYGETVYGNYNAAKYTATTAVVDLDPDGHTVVVGDATRHMCVGDSGGPALVTMGGVPTILGIDSFSATTGCTGPSNFQRMDVYQDFITSYLPTTGAGAGGAGGSSSSGGGGNSGPSGSSTSVTGSSSSGATTGSSTGLGSSGAGGSGGSTANPSEGSGCSAAPECPNPSFVWGFGVLAALAASRNRRKPQL